MEIYWYLVNRSRLQPHDKYFIFEYAISAIDPRKKFYYVSSSEFDGYYNLTSDNYSAEEILWFKQKIETGNIPASNVLIHPNLLEFWNLF